GRGRYRLSRGGVEGGKESSSRKAKSGMERVSYPIPDQGTSRDHLGERFGFSGPMPRPPHRAARRGANAPGVGPGGPPGRGRGPAGRGGGPPGTRGPGRGGTRAAPGGGPRQGPPAA